MVTVTLMVGLQLLAVEHTILHISLARACSRSLPVIKNSEAPCFEACRMIDLIEVEHLLQVRVVCLIQGVQL